MKQGGKVAHPSPPGWYPDPSGKPGNLYWDGRAWHSAIPAQLGTPPPRKQTKRTALYVVLGVLAAIVALGFAGLSRVNQPRPTFPDPAVWYRVDADDAGSWETVGPKNDANCHWVRAESPTGDVGDLIDVGQWDLKQTTGGTQKVKVNAGEYFMYWGCYPFRRAE